MSTSTIIQFNLPDELACPQPTEDRNIRRDDVRLLITEDHKQAEHTYFHQLDQYLKSGDVLVVNTSATRPSAFDAALPGNKQGRIHISTQIGREEWLIEVRERVGQKTFRWSSGKEGMEFELPGGGRVLLSERYYARRELLHLWVAKIETPYAPQDYFQHFASPIQYEKLHTPHPIEYYNTMFSFHPGSAEMPSAGRGFTPELLDRLLKKGVEVVPILLHTGVSSLEENEKPYPEYMEVTPVAAAQLNRAHQEKRRIIAVGTTAVRAVESAVNTKGEIESYQGYTSLYIQEDTVLNIFTGLLTGFHEPRASHLHMLQALAGEDHIKTAYAEALNHEYYWHQFGDLHLILKDEFKF